MGDPRILLLTLWPPDAKYKILRRNAEAWEPAKLRWASLQRCASDEEFRFGHAAFEPVPLHWRLRGGALDHLWRHHLQSAWLASRIAGWAAEFRPEVLWVLPELGAASVAHRLRRMLRIPVHATVHDAHETAAFIVPRRYYAVYRRTMDRFFACADSIDGISAGMVDHLRRCYPRLAADACVVMHPSISGPLARDAPERFPGDGTLLRRIGLCGSMRVTPRQWSEFLAILSGIPFRFEIAAFAYADLFPDVALPANVTLRAEPYVETEADVIRTFRELGVHACYLGLYREPERLLFGRTSLSAKLTTYLAAALPVIVDASADSAAWRLVERYGAGVRCGEDVAAARNALTGLLGDPAVWLAAARGAAALCRAEFDLGRNMEALRAQLRRTVRSAAGVPADT